MQLCNISTEILNSEKLFAPSLKISQLNKKARTRATQIILLHWSNIEIIMAKYI